MKFEIFTPTVIHELGQRKNQEDSVFPALGAAVETDRLFLVCDGMGGHAKGEVASANVIDAMTTWIKQRTLPNGIVSDSIIEDALQSAHARLDSLDDGAENKMGTTLTLVCLHRGGVVMGHVGDSRIYHIRPSQRQILYKSIDHSLVYELFRSGVISYDEMLTSPQRNVITRAIMPGEENKDKIDITHTTNVQPGDYFYLCSDGMLEEMSDDQLLDVLCSDSSDVMKADALVSMTEGNKDNHTALLIKIKNVIAEPGDEGLLNDEHLSCYNEKVALLPPGASTSRPPIAPQPEMPIPVPPRAPQAAAPASVNATAQTHQGAVTAGVNASVQNGLDGDAKKGVNKLLLLLVILLLAIVVGGVVFFMLNKDNSGSGKDLESNDAEKIEKVEKNEDVMSTARDRDEELDFDDDDDYDDRYEAPRKAREQKPKAPSTPREGRKVQNPNQNERQNTETKTNTPQNEDIKKIIIKRKKQEEQQTPSSESNNEKQELLKKVAEKQPKQQ